MKWHNLSRKSETYKCKSCTFITVDKGTAFSHLHQHLSVKVGDNLEKLLLNHFDIIGEPKNEITTNSSPNAQVGEEQ